MPDLRYPFKSGSTNHFLDLVLVEGTHGQPYRFGNETASCDVEVPDFYIATVPVTQALWTHVMATNPAIGHGSLLPIQNISWKQLTSPNGFIDAINASGVITHFADQLKPDKVQFRLPSETEWEYAARGGPHWRDGYRYSGSNDVNEVAWFIGNSRDSMHDTALKKPNQLGIYDMCGNAWEWCQDVFIRDVTAIPSDGSAYEGPGTERVLRGGCFHNWAEHCTVYKRYEIGEDFHDGCIGVRLVLDNRP